MNALFEYMDRLNAPYECFEMGDYSSWFPVHSHWHYYMEIIYIVRGNAMMTCDDKSFVARVGDLVLVLPHQIHSIYAVSHEPFSCLVMKFDVSQLSPAIGQTAGAMSGVHFNSLFRVARDNPNAKLWFHEEELENFPVERIFRYSIQELQAQEYGCRTMVQSCVSQLLTFILRCWRRDGFDTDQSFALRTEAESIYSITEYIDGHIQENVKVEDLAKMCNMSYSYFAKVFREVYGQSCKKYIEFVRLCKAEDLLLFTNLDLNYISQETGFADCSHFIKAFKEKYGQTPKQYRMQNSKGASVLQE
ncbi:MAG: AraC family transcriptional regulator [Eubacteriales bacterium]|nr:AraC family transcriptional regulator [Eubacteriales bacterium]